MSVSVCTWLEFHAHLPPPPFCLGEDFRRSLSDGKEASSRASGLPEKYQVHSPRCAVSSLYPFPHAWVLVHSPLLWEKEMLGLGQGLAVYQWLAAHSCRSACAVAAECCDDQMHHHTWCETLWVGNAFLMTMFSLTHALDGEKGTGKTLSLCHAVHFCAKHDWLVLHIPDGTSFLCIFSVTA